ncbi:hypothetical protein [Nostoc sp.]|uniref:hypothetical protein n=1 Tax=Nostoc sp. TaxID=1180 RepID=UPI002FFAE996
MQEFLFALTLSALPVVSNFMGAMIAEALPSSKQTLGLALHAAAGVLLAIASTELISRVAIAKPVWATILALLTAHRKITCNRARILRKNPGKHYL